MTLFDVPVPFVKHTIKVSSDIEGKLFDLEEEESKLDSNLTLTLHPSVLDDKEVLEKVLSGEKQDWVDKVAGVVVDFLNDKYKMLEDHGYSSMKFLQNNPFKLVGSCPLEMK